SLRTDGVRAGAVHRFMEMLDGSSSLLDRVCFMRSGIHVARKRSRIAHDIPRTVERAIMTKIVRKTQASATGATALGALAIGAAAIGAIAFGAMAIGRLRILEARIDKLSVGTLTVEHLEVRNQGR